MKKIVLIFSVIALCAQTAQAYQPCVRGASFCVQFINKSLHAATIKSESTAGFIMPGLHGLIIPAGGTTQYIPAFGGPGLNPKITAPWTLIITPSYSKKPIHCIMYYNNPVTFEPAGCGKALSTANPYDMTVSFHSYGD